MKGWAKDRSRDRSKGQKAEHLFKDLLEKSGYHVILTQEGLDKSFKIGKYIGGDAFVFKGEKAPIVHVEIKQKYPTQDCYFGIELYRLADYLKIQQKFKINVYYVIHVKANSDEDKKKIENCNLSDGQWIYARFDGLWNKLKGGFELKENWRSKKLLGRFKIVDDRILDVIENVRKKHNRIYLNYKEIKSSIKEVSCERTEFGRINLFDISYYKGQTGETATLVYFKTSWFKDISHFIEDELPRVLKLVEQNKA